LSSTNLFSIVPSLTRKDRRIEWTKKGSNSDSKHEKIKPITYSDMRIDKNLHCFLHVLLEFGMESIKGAINCNCCMLHVYMVQQNGKTY